MIPVVGLTIFPTTENFPNTRDHTVASIFRRLLGKGFWWTRVLTGGRQSLVTDDPNAVAQNLAAESNNFENANRNQYGSFLGREKTNYFRTLHRLPTDESIVRTFIAQSFSTMINNGVEHTIRQVSCCTNAFIFCVHYLCLFGRVYVIYVGHVDKIMKPYSMF
jgi:hypothetical protein